MGCCLDDLVHGVDWVIPKMWNRYVHCHRMSVDDLPLLQRSKSHWSLIRHSQFWLICLPNQQSSLSITRPSICTLKPPRISRRSSVLRVIPFIVRFIGCTVRRRVGALQAQRTTVGRKKCSPQSMGVVCWEWASSKAVLCLIVPP